MSGDYADLRALADAATPGPWYWRNSNLNVYLLGARSRAVMAFRRMGMNGAQPEFRKDDGLLHPTKGENLNDFADAAYIAAAHPARILALLADLDAAERSNAAMEQHVVNLNQRLDEETARRVAARAEVDHPGRAWKRLLERAETAERKVEAVRALCDRADAAAANPEVIKMSWADSRTVAVDDLRRYVGETP